MTDDPLLSEPEIAALETVAKRVIQRTKIIIGLNGEEVFVLHDGVWWPGAKHPDLVAALWLSELRPDVLLRLIAAVRTLRKERDEAHEFLERHGYRRCDIPACNCPFWHGGHAADRLREISDTLADAGIPGGTTIHGGVLTLRERAEQAEASLVALREERDTLKQQLEAQGWRDIASAPKDGTRIMLAWKHGVVMARWRDEAAYAKCERRPGWEVDDCEGDCWFSFSLEPDAPTHWQPLPAPPTTEQS